MKLFCVEYVNGERTFVVAERMEDAVSLQSVATPRKCEMIANTDRSDLSTDRMVIISYPAN